MLAFFVLREPLTISLLLGTLLVVTGVFLTNRRAPSAASRPKPRAVRIPPSQVH
jgi:drug/metabolite transporter (DMT)-like permease